MGTSTSENASIVRTLFNLLKLTIAHLFLISLLSDSIYLKNHRKFLFISYFTSQFRDNTKDKIQHRD